MGKQKSNSTRQDVLFSEESYEIKAACLAVHEALGCGFLEKVYENALTHELRKHGFTANQQVAYQVFYDGLLMGDYVADMVIDDKIIIEVKASEKDTPIHKAQLINYLKASGIQLGILVNFGLKFFSFERVIFTK